MKCEQHGWQRENERCPRCAFVPGIGAEQLERQRAEAQRAARARRPETTSKSEMKRIACQKGEPYPFEATNCGPTHHNACACREAYFAKLEGRLKTAADAERVVAWIKDPYEPSHIHFTEGPERQIAYAVDELFSKLREFDNKLKLAEEALERLLPAVNAVLADMPEEALSRNVEEMEESMLKANEALAELRKA